MKIKFITFAILLLSVSIGFGQTAPDTVWTKTLGGSYVEAYGVGLDSKATMVMSSDQKSLYVVTTTASHDGYVTDSMGYLDGWLLKMNLEGDTLWTDVVGGSDYDAITDVAATPDGGCVICGYSNSTNGDFKNTGLHLNPDMPDYVLFDGFIAKYSADGVQEWIKMYGGQPLVEMTSVGSDKLLRIIVTKDGGYMSVGYTFSTSDDLPIDLERFRGGWMLKTDSKGKIEHTDKFTGINHNDENNNILYDIVEVSEDMYYVLGEQRYYSNPDKLWVIKTDGVKILAEKEYGAEGDNNLSSSIVQGPSGTFFVTGIIQSATGDVKKAYAGFDIWLIQIDNDLSLIDQRTLGGTSGEYPYKLASDGLGHYLLAAYTRSTDNDAFGGYGVTDFWAINFDENLDTLQTYKFGGSQYDALTGAVFSKDGKDLYVCGTTDSNDFFVHGSQGGGDIWVARIRQDETLSAKGDLIENKTQCTIYPNPSKGLFYIQNSKNENITITDISGKILLTKSIETDNQEVDIHSFTKGIYFVKFSGSKVMKLIIE